MDYAVAVKVTQTGAETVTSKINALEKALEMAKKTADALAVSLTKLSSVANINVNVNTSDINNAENSVEDVTQAVERLNREINSINTDRFNELQNNINRVPGAINGAANSTGGFMGALGKVGGVIASVFAIGQIASWGQQAITTASEMERLKNMLNTMVGSADATAQAMERIKTMEQGIASIDLKSGIESVTAFMRMGKDEATAEGFTQALGKAVDYYGGTSQQVSLAIAQLEQLSGKTSGFGEDLRSLSNSLPGVKQMLTEAFGVQTVEEINELGVTGSQVVDTLISKFNELPQVQVGIAGTFAQLQAKITDIFTKVGEKLAPVIEQIADTFLPVIEKVGVGFADWISQIASMPQFQEILNNIASVLTDIAEVIFVILSDKSSLEALMEIVKFGTELLQVVVKILKQIFDWFWKVTERLREFYNEFLKKCLKPLKQAVKWLDKLTFGKFSAGTEEETETESTEPENIPTPVMPSLPEMPTLPTNEIDNQQNIYDEQLNAQNNFYDKMIKGIQNGSGKQLDAQKKANNAQIAELDKVIKARTDYVNKVKAEIDRMRQAEQKEADDKYNLLKNYQAGVTASGINHKLTENTNYSTEEIYKASANLQKAEYENNMVNSQIDRALYGNSTQQMVAQKNSLESNNQQLDNMKKGVDQIVEQLRNMKECVGNIRDMAKQDMSYVL